MQRLALAALVAVVLAGPIAARHPAAAGPPAEPVPVVVELFTSEGCSSCPAADEALRALTAAQSVLGVEVIALGQHIDYWNRLGWADPFSAPAFTARQRQYATALGSGTYTPQAVVNGRYELVGSRREALADAVRRAAQAPRATVAVTAGAGGTVRVRVTDLPPGTAPADVVLVLTEAGLSTQVKRGENAGRRLEHAAVVRHLQALGPVAADGTFTATVPLRPDSQWLPDHLRAVVLVQEQASRRIVGVGQLAWPVMKAE